MNKLVEAALSYAAKGYSVFPCKPRTKEPATKHGFYDATTDEQQIKTWWNKNPEYNIAIPTGMDNEIIVLDIDDLEAQTLLEERGWNNTDTVTTMTGRGLHRYYHVPYGIPIPGRTIASKVDVKAEGGYVIAPPSVHPDGKVYEWLPGYSPDELEIADAPAWLLSEVQGFDLGQGKTIISRLSRTLLGDALRNGVPEPVEFEPDLLLKGKVHQVFSGPGSGKSWLALWLVMQAIKRGESVLYLDMENGKRIISERLQDLGVSGDGIDEHLHYFDFPALDMGSEAKREYVSLLDRLKPHLIVFDSWVNFLAASGLEENSNTDVEQWSNAYVHQARIRDCTVVLLDHIPHEGNHSRGATREKDMVDVQWRLKKVQDFDRGSVGYIQLMREKDREGWLPENVGFSVGGTDTGFIMKRSEGTVEKTGDGLPESARKALAALVSFGEAGATYTEWRKATEWKDGKPMPDTTFRTNAVPKLKEEKLVRHEGDKYYSTNSTATAQHHDAVGQIQQHSTAPPLRGAVSAVDDSGKDRILTREDLGEMNDGWPNDFLTRN